MMINKQLFKSTALTALLFSVFGAGGIAQDTSNVVGPETKAPVILATSPIGGEMNVDRNSVIKITFSSEMDSASINSATLLLYATYADTMKEQYREMHQEQITDNLTIEDSKNYRQHTAGAISGTIRYSDKIAVFTPDKELKEGTLYSFTVTSGVKNSENIALETDQSWSFTTAGTSYPTYSDKQNNTYGTARVEVSSLHAMSTNKDKTKGVDLGKAGRFVILAKTSVKNNTTSRITGHIGEGSVASSTNKEKENLNSTRKPASGKVSVLRSNQGDTTSPDVTEAIEDMMTAFNDVSMQNGDDSTSHTNESFDKVVVAPGVYEWSDSLHIASDVTLSGSANDVWLIKVGENLTIDENIEIMLTNGARAANIFWYVEGEVTIGKNARFEGIILSKNEITLEKGAELNGRMFSQTSITLNDNTIIREPRNMASQTSSKNR